MTGSKSAVRWGVLALSLIGAFTLLNTVVKYVRTLESVHSVVRAFLTWFTKPILSVADLLLGILIILIIYAVIWMAAFGPMPSSRS